jgi:hypothetical protein
VNPADVLKHAADSGVEAVGKLHEEKHVVRPVPSNQFMRSKMKKAAAESRSQQSNFQDFLSILEILVFPQPRYVSVGI